MIVKNLRQNRLLRKHTIFAAVEFDVMKAFKVFWVSIMALANFAANAQVVINEYCASSTSFLDEYGDNADWIELYNTSSADVNLEGWHLSDKVWNWDMRKRN